MGAQRAGRGGKHSNGTFRKCTFCSSHETTGHRSKSQDTWGRRLEVGVCIMHHASCRRGRRENPRQTMVAVRQRLTNFGSSIHNTWQKGEGGRPLVIHHTSYIRSTFLEHAGFLWDAGHLYLVLASVGNLNGGKRCQRHGFTYTMYI